MSSPDVHADPALDAAYAPLRDALAQEPVPRALDDAVLAAFRVRHAAKPARFASLRAWLQPVHRYWLSLGSGCAVALAALVWLGPISLHGAMPASYALPMSPQETELATAFFAVGDPARLAQAPHARMVRVQVPRATLANYGLPFNPELADQPIMADLLVGDDGSTLAVRFVHGKLHLM